MQKKDGYGEVLFFVNDTLIPEMLHNMSFVILGIKEDSKVLHFIVKNYKQVAFCQKASGEWDEKILKLMKAPFN